MQLQNAHAIAFVKYLVLTIKTWERAYLRSYVVHNVIYHLVVIHQLIRQVEKIIFRCSMMLYKIPLRSYCKTRNFDERKLRRIWRIGVKLPNFIAFQSKATQLSVQYKTKTSTFSSISSMFLSSKFFAPAFAKV